MILWLQVYYAIPLGFKQVVICQFVYLGFMNGVRDLCCLDHALKVVFRLGLEFGFGWCVLFDMNNLHFLIPRCFRNFIVQLLFK